MNDSVIRALDGSRRVGWAKYFDAQEEIATLREALNRLSDAVVFHPRISNGDQILDLVQIIREL
jgi:hypothetical protein